MSTTDDNRILSRRTFLRKLATAGGATLGASVLAACGAPAATNTATGEVAGTAVPGVGGSGPITLELWTFANTHARWFRKMGEDYKKNVNPNVTLNVSEFAFADMHDKLKISLQSGGVGAPDLADIEQGSFGGFLLSDNTGLVDLSDRLKGYNDKLVQARQALYSYEGKTYGIEHALTPVVLYYRSDLWETVGVDPATFKTWDEYIVGAKKLAKGDVMALSFPPHDVLLRQRGGDYFDQEGKVQLDSDLSVETMEWILALRDEHKIAAQAPDEDPVWWTAVNQGKYASQVGADWYAGFFKDNAPDLKGKWRATSLPAFTADGLRTSCWGGTGNCIVATSKNVEEAWKYQEYSMLSTEGNVQRFLETSLFPPFLPATEDPRLHRKDPYFSEQDLGQVFADVAASVPVQYQSPHRAEMNSKLTPMWQDVYDGKVKPGDAFKQIADEIRKSIEQA